MNIRTARDILGFPISNSRRSVERNRTHPKNEIRNESDSYTSKSKTKKSRRYFEHRIKHVQTPQPSIPISMASQFNSWDEDYVKQTNRVPETHSIHPLSHYKFAKMVHYSQINDNKLIKTQKKLEQPFHYPRISRTEHEIQRQKQQNAEQSDVLARNGGHVLRRQTPKKAIAQRQPPSKQNIFGEKDEKYYVSDLKRSAHEYINDIQYVNPYLSHLMDSISAFQVNMHIGIPKNIQKSIELPPPQRKITLVFDLDETLLHTQVTNDCSSLSSGDWGSVVQICTQNGDYSVNLKIRPHATEVLNRLKEKFQLGVFTASQEPYGRAILNVLDPDSTIFSFKLYRQHCLEVHSRINHVKDLRILKNRELSKLVLIDNSPQAYLFQKNNAVPIIPFFSDTEDIELLKLQKFLNILSDVEDVRPILKDYFKFEQYHTYKNMLKLVRELYR